MKKVTQGYVIVDKKGRILIGTFKEKKSICIDEFEETGMYMSWVELKALGYKCVKSTQTIEIKE